MSICCNTYWTYPNTQSLYRWKNHDFVERDCFSSDDESDLAEEQDNDDLPIVIPTRKANPRTKTKPKRVIPKNYVPVRPHAIKRAIPETPGPPPGLLPKRMRHIQVKASNISEQASNTFYL